MALKSQIAAKAKTTSTKKAPTAKAPLKKAKVIDIKTKSKAGSKAPATTKAKPVAGSKAPAAKTVAAKKGFPARKPGTARKAPARKPLPLFTAPADFKPHFIEVSVRTEKDGLLGNAIKATRYVGRYDENAPDNKKFDLGSYDARTLYGIMARLSGPLFKATNEKKFPVLVKGRTEVKGAMRLPALTVFRILLRVNKKAKDGSLSVLFKHVVQVVKSTKTGRPQDVQLEKNDPVYRSFRKSARTLPAAFKDSLMPPKKVRGRKVEQAEDEE